MRKGLHAQNVLHNQTAHSLVFRDIHVPLHLFTHQHSFFLPVSLKDTAMQSEKAAQETSSRERLKRKQGIFKKSRDSEELEKARTPNKGRKGIKNLSL